MNQVHTQHAGALTLFCGLIFISPASADTALNPIHRVEAPDHSSLVLLKSSSSLRNAGLVNATVYALPTQTLAVLPYDEVTALVASGEVFRTFSGDPEEGIFYLAEAGSASQRPPLSFHPVLQDGNVALYRIDPSEATALGQNGARLQRVIWLPQFEEPLSTSGLAADPDLSALTEQVTEDSWGQWVSELSGDTSFLLDDKRCTISSRHVSTDGNTLAGDYLADRLETMGYRPQFQEFTYNGSIERNVIVEIPGTSKTKDVVVLGAHFDSTASGSVANAPGADDNGSGSAALLEVARLIKGAAFESTVDLVWFNAEEVGLIGSQEYVRQSAREGKRITGAIVLDMISYFSRDYSLHVEGMVRYRAFMDIAVEAARDYSDLKTSNRYYSFGSDHVSFQSANIPAYLLIEAEWDSNPTYHTPNDTFNRLMPHMGSEATKVALAALASAAGLTLP